MVIIKILEVAIGLSLVYLLLSILSLVLLEAISQAFALRSQGMERGLKRLLQDDRVFDEFNKHPLFTCLKGKRGILRWQTDIPSYIEPKSFSAALFG